MEIEHISDAYQEFKESLDGNIEDNEFILNKISKFFSLSPIAQRDFFNTVRDIHFNLEHLLMEIIQNDVNGVSLGQQPDKRNRE